MEFKPPKSLVVDENIVHNWKLFSQSFEIYMLASGRSTSTTEVQAAILLNFIGEEGLELYNTFKLSETDRKDVNKIKKAFEDHIKPRRNVIYERFLFYSRKQQVSESFEHFLTELKTRVKNCDFGDKEEEMIRDRIVMGLQCRDIQERLLRTTDLSLQSCVDICRASEISKAQASMLQPEMETEAISSRTYAGRYQKNFRNNKTNQYQCRKCNLKHGSKSCPAFGKVCNLCQKPNHFASGCFYRNKNGQQVQEIHAESDDGMLIDEMLVSQVERGDSSR